MRCLRVYQKSEEDIGVKKQATEWNKLIERSKEEKVCEEEKLHEYNKCLNKKNLCNILEFLGFLGYNTLVMFFRI